MPVEEVTHGFSNHDVKRSPLKPLPASLNEALSAREAEYYAVRNQPHPYAMSLYFYVCIQRNQRLSGSGRLSRAEKPIQKGRTITVCPFGFDCGW